MGNFEMKITDGKVSAIVKYTPAYTKVGTGIEVAQKAVIPVIVNKDPYVGKDGKLVDGQKVLAFITAWGKVADTVAKYFAVGKSFSCEGTVGSYVSKVRDSESGVIILNSVGAPAESIKHGFTMDARRMQFGADSADQIQKEKRPLGWNGFISIADFEGALASGGGQNILAQAKQGKAMWDKIRADLKALQYTPGMTVFGKAKVEISPDAVPVPNAYNALSQDIANAIPTVDGHTYEAMVAGGWTDELLLTTDGGKWACLVPKKVPAVPSTPAAPAPPAQNTVLVPDGTIEGGDTAGEQTITMTSEVGGASTV